VRQHVAVDGVERRVVDVGREHAFLQVVEHDDLRCATETTEGLLVQLGPDLRARAKRQEPDALAAPAQRAHEQPHPAVLARLRVAHHRAVAVVALALGTRRRLDHRMCLEGLLPAQRHHEAPHTLIAVREPVIVDQVLPHRHRVAALSDTRLDELAVGLARTRRRAATGPT